MNELTIEAKTRILSRMYFGISDSENHDVNPFEDLPTFLKSKVKSLQWGKQKKASKERFCKKFIQVLELYNIQLSQEIIMKALEKDETMNKEVVKGWVSSALFEDYSPVKKTA